MSDKPEYALSTSNKLYFGIVAVVIIALFLVNPDLSPEHIGRLIGRVFSLLLFPAMFAWIVWRLTGKKENGGSITFNVVLTLILLGQVAQTSRTNMELESIQVEKEKFQDTFASSENPEEVTTAYNEYVDNMQNSFKDLSDQNTGAKKQFFAIMANFTSESQKIAQAWQQSYLAVSSDRLLDYSLLNNDKEFQYQKSILQDYIGQTETYGESYKNTLPRLQKDLSVLDQNDPMVKGAIEGATEKYEQQRPIFEPLMQAHLSYGKNLISVLDLLHDHQGQWSSEDGQIQFNDDDTLESFNQLVEQLIDNETSINTLAEQLVKTL